MVEKQRARDPIPERFETLREAADFWDSHDLSDYDDLTEETRVEVDLGRHRCLAALEPELAKQVAECAHQQGVTSETLINLWLSEKLLAATRG